MDAEDYKRAVQQWSARTPLQKSMTLQANQNRLKNNERMTLFGDPVNPNNPFGLGEGGKKREWDDFIKTKGYLPGQGDLSYWRKEALGFSV